MTEDEDILGVNDSVLLQSGLDVHVHDFNRRVIREVPSLRDKRHRPADAEANDAVLPTPIVKSSTLLDKEAKRCTGFASAVSLLSYITVVCNANFDTMTSTQSEMTWFEEWFLYLEVVWGRSCARWVDFEAKYKVSRKVLARVFLDKLKLVLNAKDAWPRYASLEEDEKLRGRR